jgi:putative glutamine amidotransferase
MSHRRPLIGIVSNFDVELDRYWSAAAYSRNVAEAGGAPVLLPYALTDCGVDEVIDVLDGLVLSGGGDIDPRRYATQWVGTATNVVDERDAFEFAITEAALDRQLPTFGICRGLQSLNVACGGTLHVDLSTADRRHADHAGALERLRHEVTVAPDSTLAELVGPKPFSVNSDHHQAVLEPGGRLRPVCWSDDGVIEAVEGTDTGFLIAVQWHPERIDTPQSRSLFSALVDAARQAMWSRGSSRPGRSGACSTGPTAATS